MCEGNYQSSVGRCRFLESTADSPSDKSFCDNYIMMDIKTESDANNRMFFDVGFSDI